MGCRWWSIDVGSLAGVEVGQNVGIGTCHGFRGLTFNSVGRWDVGNGWCLDGRFMNGRIGLVGWVLVDGLFGCLDVEVG